MVFRSKTTFQRKSFKRKQRASQFLLTELLVSGNGRNSGRREGPRRERKRDMCRMVLNYLAAYQLVMAILSSAFQSIMALLPF